MKVSSFLPRNFVGVWKRWELGLCVERGYKIHDITSIFDFFHFSGALLEAEFEESWQSAYKNCLIVFNLSFYTYLSNQSLKSADFLWQSFLDCSCRWARSAQRHKRLSLTGWRLIIACTGLDLLMFDKFCVIFCNFFFRHFEEKFQQEVQRWTVPLRQEIRKDIYHLELDMIRHKRFILNYYWRFRTF